jgi:hypothetical protein
MQVKTDCSPQPSPDAASGGTRSPGNAFTPEFLERLRRKADPPTARQAALSGPWEVEPVWSENHGRLFAVSRRDEPVAKGGSAFGVFLTRPVALAVAAVLPVLGQPQTLRLKRHGRRRGYALHDDRELLGHLAREEEAFPLLLQLARVLTARPDSLALLLEAAGPEALTLLGRKLDRRVGRAG